VLLLSSMERAGGRQAAVGRSVQYYAVLKILNMTVGNSLGFGFLPGPVAISNDRTTRNT
jgi:hypothetical protein